MRRKKIKNQTTNKKLSILKLRRVFKGHGRDGGSYRIEIACTELLKNIFNDNNLNIENVRYYWVRKKRKIILHFIKIK